MKGLFLQILVFAEAAGCLKVGKVGIDGTKVQANASKHKAPSWGHANRPEEQLMAEIDILMEKAEEAEMSAEAGPKLDVPAEIARREARLGVVRQARAEIEARAAERDAEARREWEEKMAARKAKEAETGRKPGGRPPEEPEPGPQAKD